MRVITLNLNGIRSAAQKGFFEWMAQQNADFVCVQETRTSLQNDGDDIFHPAGYHCYFHNAEKKGYSGTGLYSKHKPKTIKIGLGWPTADREGRAVELNFGKFSIVSLYIPSGTSGDERQRLKYDFLEHYLALLRQIKKSDQDYIVAGDINIAHKQIDLKNWRSNQKHSGFLPEERAWLDKLFNEGGFVDAFRAVNKEPDQYTWWSNFGRAREKNVGWRIDYQIVTPGLRDKIKAASIYKDQRFSDHAPLIVDYDYEIKV